ncbi:cell division protein FtsQ/DivIB [Halochromatium sp.]
MAEPAHHQTHQAALVASARTLTRLGLLSRLLSAALLIGALIGASWIGLQWEPTLLPIRAVSIEGEMHGLSREALQETISNEITGGILTQNLATLRARVQALPWVEQATARRIWPDRVQVTVREHSAIARWNESGLVTENGEVFRPSDGRLPAGLARLGGADDERAPEVVARFFDWGSRLLALGLIVDAVQCDARGDWSIELLGGTDVLLGTDDVEERLERLIAAYSQIEAIGIPTRLDLRYANGLAVRWLPIANSAGAPKRIAAN